MLTDARLRLAARQAQKRLADYSSGRDNNFNLLRLVAASMVLVSHSYALSTGNRAIEPLRAMLGVTLGELAVDIFFVASGFLVAGSLLVRQDLAEFLAARALRIFPGLWVALTITVLVVGLWFTSLDFGSYLLNKETWRHYIKNALLFRGIVYELPGAFEHAPYAGAVNGSLWTLPKELAMYGILAAAWFLIKHVMRRPALWLKVFCVGLGIVALAADLATFATHQPSLFIGLLAKFFVGAALRVMHQRIPVSGLLFAAMLVAVGWAAFVNPLVFGVVYRVVVAYLVIYVALVPGGPVRWFSRIGDYSYGIYIYAFPVQQAIASVWRGITPIEMYISSFIATFAFAYTSWHLVEERALKLKSLVRARRADDVAKRAEHA